MTVVRVCDAMMGAGKTSAAINYMNSHGNKHFLFITPYLDECDRIVRACAEQNFVAPWKDENSKFENLHTMLGQGRNLASTHAMMHKFNGMTVDLIKQNHYTLVLDEVFDVLSEMKLCESDVALLRDAHAIEVDSAGLCHWLRDQYGQDGVFADLAKMCREGQVTEFDGDILIWQFPQSIFEAFDEVIILTYMFRDQIQRAYFDLHNIGYEYIGVRPCASGYEFCDVADMPRCAIDLLDKIHIVERDDLNEGGNAENALSVNWTRRETENGHVQLDKIVRAAENLARHIWGVRSENLLWTCAKEHRDVLGGKGYKSSFLAWNYRATNEYRDKTHLIYLHNVYMNPNIFMCLAQCGAGVDADGYALTSLIQWIWRSAIRDGKEIWIYIPSVRMRRLLRRWIADVAAGDA